MVNEDRVKPSNKWEKDHLSTVSTLPTSGLCEKTLLSGVSLRNSTQEVFYFEAFFFPELELIYHDWSGCMQLLWDLRYK